LPRPVADLLWPAEEGAPRLLRPIALALVGVLLLWASAKIHLPFQPVPLSLQSAVVLMVGITYGPRLGMLTILLYLAMGAIGLPVFAGTPQHGTGLLYMTGPTGGYLLGFLPAAGIVGAVAARRTHWSEIAGGALIATFVIYLFGVTWLSGFVGWKEAMAVGMAPFMLGDLLKLILVTVLSETTFAAAQRWVRAG
jgi:biotin transport system substrate-specific component